MTTPFLWLSALRRCAVPLCFSRHTSSQACNTCAPRFSSPNPVNNATMRCIARRLVFSSATAARHLDIVIARDAPKAHSIALASFCSISAAPWSTALRHWCSAARRSILCRSSFAEANFASSARCAST